jgi:hypothetical protein
MIKIASTPRSNESVPDWHSTFLKLLPIIESHAKATFAYLDRDARAEAVAEAVAHAMIAIIGLVDRGKEPRLFPGQIAHFAVLRVKTGRLVAGQSANDVLSPMAQQLGGFEKHSLDDNSCDPDTGWKAAATTDTRTWPVPDVVSFRVDFEEWLNGIGRRDRRIMEHLAVGDRPGEVARKFGLSPSGISKMRERLRQS